MKFPSGLSQLDWPLSIRFLDEHLDLFTDGIHAFHNHVSHIH